VAVFVAVLLFALVVARTCGRVGDKVSQEEAVSIARAQIDFDAEHHQSDPLPGRPDRCRERRCGLDSRLLILSVSDCDTPVPEKMGDANVGRSRRVS
jgi:hypothetical protein